MAEPPQIPVPALIRLLVFQLRPRALPISAPRPKQVARVKSITVREKRPTVNTVPIFRLAPSRIIANFSSFFEVNLIPGVVALPGFQKALMIMPMNRAMTEAPIMCNPAEVSRFSRSLAMAAIPRASRMPGIREVNFLIMSFFPFDIFIPERISFFDSYYHCCMIK